MRNLEFVEKITVGKYEAVLLRDAPFGLDAGTMFHMVPRVLWQKKIMPDADNRVFFGLNCLLLKGEGRTILFDAGVGNKLNEKHKRIYGLDPDITLLKALGEAGVGPEEVDTVVPSHLHFDHAGWLTIRKKNGELCPAFPNARYIIQKAEWEAAHQNNELTAGSYMREDFAPLEQSGALELVDGDVQVAPSVKAELTGGHSPGHQVLVVASGKDKLLCPSEIVPTRWHLRVSWLTCFDLEPAVVLEVKKRLLKTAAAENWRLFLSHDPSSVFGRVRPGSSREYEWQPLR